MLGKRRGNSCYKLDWQGKIRCASFFGYRIEEKNWDIEHLLNVVSVQELVASQKFPIAENCLGDTFCIDSTDGSIWIVYHDAPSSKKIAENFESFIKGCKSKRLGHIRTIEERRQFLLEKRGREPTAAQLKGWQEEIEVYSKMTQEEVIL